MKQKFYVGLKQILMMIIILKMRKLLEKYLFKEIAILKILFILMEILTIII
jgi:hypothetical protein